MVLVNDVDLKISDILRIQILVAKVRVDMLRVHHIALFQDVKDLLIFCLSDLAFKIIKLHLVFDLFYPVSKFLHFRYYICDLVLHLFL